MKSEQIPTRTLCISNSHKALLADSEALEPAVVSGDLQFLECMDVGEILDVDRQYRDAVARDALPKIAPRRFNPSHEAWLPLLHTTRGDRHYTALYSNTARAHELGRTHDWLVIYFDGRGIERQCTVITAERGRLRGHRIVRGLEDECLRHYFGARQPVSGSQSTAGAGVRGVPP